MISSKISKSKSNSSMSSSPGVTKRGHLCREPLNIFFVEDTSQDVKDDDIFCMR